MFLANKPLPPLPLSKKTSWKSKENAGEASALGTTVRPRPSSAAGMYSLPVTTYSPAVTDYVYRRVLRQAVAALCKQGGFEVIETDVLELLTHMVNSYIIELASTTRQMTEHAGRSVSTPSDTMMALVDLGGAISKLPLFLKETISKGSLMIAPPRMQHTPHTQHQLRVGSSRQRPSHIPDWLPPFPDPHTYLRTNISGEPELSYEKAREGLATLHRNTITSLKNFVLLTHSTISLFDAHKQHILKKIDAAAAAKCCRQRQLSASIAGNEQNLAMTNGEAAAAVLESEQLSTTESEFSGSNLRKSLFFEEDSEAETDLLHVEAPTFSEVIEPKATNEPYLDALVFDVQKERTPKIKESAPDDTGPDVNPFLCPAKMPVVMDDDPNQS